MFKILIHRHQLFHDKQRFGQGLIVRFGLKMAIVLEGRFDLIVSKADIERAIPKALLYLKRPD